MSVLCYNPDMQENPEYLTTQLITYLGNKRKLIFEIEKQVSSIKMRLKKEKCVCADLFSCSGIVSRMLKQHSSCLIANDIEDYAMVLNSCYLSDKSDFDENYYDFLRNNIEESFGSYPYEGIITKNYAPKDDNRICPGERVFYTHLNAVRIDTYRKLIDDCIDKDDFKKFFLAPLIVESSVHTNTSGVFKGFYKDKKTGTGCFGGNGRNALSRIMGSIELKKPVLSNFECERCIIQKDAVELAKELSGIDITYLDPPYNQHPYGSNYFMLNLIIKNEITAPMSNVSGIVSGWNRSVFNRRETAVLALEEIIKGIDSKFIIISYNSEGFIAFDTMLQILKRYGKYETVEIKYNTFRGSRNLRERNIHVKEYLFILEKK